jgi:Zn finger protein HypA/HybF involved in hydrogenase expression
MRVRCGACRNQFDVAGAGRFACPVCGSVNVVRNAQGAAPVEEAPPPPPTSMGGYPTAPGAAPGGAPPRQQPPPKPEEPMPKVECPECGFSFIVGLVDTVTCPMCSAEVDTGIDSDEAE